MSDAPTPAAERQREYRQRDKSATRWASAFVPSDLIENLIEGGLLPEDGSTDKKNLGASLQERDQLCQIGDPHAFEAVLVVDQADVNLVVAYRNRTENNGRWPLVDMKLDAYRWRTFAGEIEKVALAPMEHASAALASQGGGELDAKTTANGMLKPISTSYQARVRFDDEEELLRVGLTGQAKIYTGWQPVYQRVARYLYRTFRFNW